MEENAEAAVLFADVSGSTRLYEVAGDRAAFAAIEKCVSLLKERTQAAGGRVIKTIGDEVMAMFPDTDSAARAALQMQQSVAALEPTAGARIGVRIGFQWGPVVERDGDLFGDTVNLASRLAEAAVRDQIITSRSTVERMSPVLRNTCRPLYEMPIKGKAAEIEIFEMVTQSADTTTTVLAMRTIPRPAARATMRLKYASADLSLGDDRPALTIGRDKSADLVVEDRKASRLHCRIERRLDKFVLTDHSANGTYVTLGEDAETVLRREELALRGRGWIALGLPRAETTEVIEFFCE